MAAARAVPPACFRRGKTVSPRPLSDWKNKGKNPSRKPVKGGFAALDALYDSDSELTGFSFV
jgi:hypothetical protein